MDEHQEDAAAGGSPMAGWYAAEPGQERWWDGRAWTDHVRAAQHGSPQHGPTHHGPTHHGPAHPAGGPRWGIVLPVAALVLALVVGAAVGLSFLVGGDDAGDAPTNASTDDFCDALDEAYGTLFALVFQETDRPWETGRAVQALTETGTPEDIPDDARAGFEELVTALEAADGMTYEELEESGEIDMDDDESDDSPESDAFEAYAEDTCGSFFGD